MGDGIPEVINTRRARAERSRGLTAVYAVMVAVMILILLQFLLLMVALEDYLSGNRAVLWGSAAGSAFCFVGSCWLIRYVSRK